MTNNDEVNYALQLCITELQLCITELLHAGVPTNPKHPRRVALDVAKEALASHTATVEQAGEVVVYTYQFDYETQSRHLLDGPVADGDKFVTLDAYKALSALGAQPRPVGVPDGWKLVPAKPTSSMVDVACIDYGVGSITAGCIYKAMLAAAPAPEKGGQS